MQSRLVALRTCLRLYSTSVGRSCQRTQSSNTFAPQVVFSRGNFATLQQFELLTQVHVQRCIHTSSRNNVTPKLLILMVRPILSMVSGKLFKSWWRRQPIEKRSKFIAYGQRHKNKIWTGIGVYLGAVLVYWGCNVRETPITRRKRFISFDAKQIESITEAAAEEMTKSYDILPLFHPAAQRVLRVAKKIVLANGDIKQFRDLEWKVTLLNVPGMVNAMVTGQGQIIVFKEIVDQCATDEELAVVLSHEMAHAILDHVPEKLSNAYLVGFFTAPVLFLIWAILPSDISAAIIHFLYHNVVSFVVSLPYSRMLEEEADEVGLKLAARACVDVRQAVSFWQRMDYMEKEGYGVDPTVKLPKTIEYFSTHPTHESRWKKLEQLLEEALLLRDTCRCPPLGKLPTDDVRLVKELGELAAHIRIVI